MSETLNEPRVPRIPRLWRYLLNAVAFGSVALMFFDIRWIGISALAISAYLTWQTTLFQREGIAESKHGVWPREVSPISFWFTVSLHWIFAAILALFGIAVLKR